MIVVQITFNKSHGNYRVDVLEPPAHDVPIRTYLPSIVTVEHRNEVALSNKDGALRVSIAADVVEWNQAV